MSARAAWARAGLVLGVVLLADQLAKALVTASLRRGERDAVFVGIELVNVRNSGVAFGALQDGGTIIAVVIVLAIAALLAYFARNARRPWAWLATGLLLGGALGNAVDRLREGAVIDFVKLPLWPAFNLADVAITAGVLALLLVIERGDDGARGRA
ncbi:MAG: signal peptidase II [Solirubrobacterales bacterium]|nr:signal peptidase II [Solirubrobacterales bacterium]